VPRLIHLVYCKNLTPVHFVKSAKNCKSWVFSVLACSEGVSGLTRVTAEPSYARTPKSPLLNSLFLAHPLSKIDAAFRYNSQEVIEPEYKKILYRSLIVC
jgi:hypothetical protein